MLSRQLQLQVCRGLGQGGEERTSRMKCVFLGIRERTACRQSSCSGLSLFKMRAVKYYAGFSLSQKGLNFLNMSLCSAWLFGIDKDVPMSLYLLRVIFKHLLWEAHRVQSSEGKLHDNSKTQGYIVSKLFQGMCQP